MKLIRVGDITIDAVIEREGPWRRPQDFFPTYDEAAFKRKRIAEALQIVCADSWEHRKKSNLLQGCSQWTTIRTT